MRIGKMSQRLLFTVGHSTRTWKDFIALLKVWKIRELVDVRTVPRSRAFPWFEKERMQRALPKAGIAYCHLAALGGLRYSKKGSINTGWRNASFRGYADYMQTKDFEKGLKDLNRRRRKHRICVMCSEAVWWRCHRRMIADAEIARGIPVRHIMTEKSAVPHQLTVFARLDRKYTHSPVITYPP
ncbi:MAG: DUF488 family protein [Phycisphaerae bacterium]